MKPPSGRGSKLVLSNGGFFRRSIRKKLQPWSLVPLIFHIDLSCTLSPGVRYSRATSSDWQRIYLQQNKIWEKQCRRIETEPMRLTTFGSRTPSFWRHLLCSATNTDLRSPPLGDTGPTGHLQHPWFRKPTAFAPKTQPITTMQTIPNMMVGSLQTMIP